MNEDDDFKPIDIDIDKLVEEAMRPMMEMTNEEYLEYVKKRQEEKAKLGPVPDYAKEWIKSALEFIESQED
jgi:hypothetical protein